MRPARGRRPGFGASQEARAPRRCRHGLRDFPSGRGARPSLGPPAPAPPPSPRRLRRALHTAANAERKLGAPPGRRCQDRADRAVFFLFRISRLHCEVSGPAPLPPSSSLPSPLLPLPLPRPERPASRSLAGGLAAAWATGGDPGARSALAHPVPGLCGSASPRGETRRRGAHRKETPVASRATPNTIRTALMRL